MGRISDDAYEELRIILEKQYGQAFILEDVKEIGNGFVDFYSVLGELYNDKQESKILE